MKTWPLLLLALLPTSQSGGAPAYPSTFLRCFSMCSQPQPSSQQVVHDFLTAVQHGKLDQVAAALHPQVRWSQPGHNRLAGLKHSRDEVFQMVGSMQTLTAGTLALTTVDLLSVNGNRVACRLHWRAAQPTGAVLNVDNIDVYTIDHGLITQVEVFTADAAQEDAFWA